MDLNVADLLNPHGFYIRNALSIKCIVRKKTRKGDFSWINT